MNRTLCCGVVLVSVGLLGWAGVQRQEPSGKPEATAAQAKPVSQPPALTAEERAFVGDWVVDIDAVAAMSDPGWIHNSVRQYEDVRISVRADHTAFACTPVSLEWFRWTLVDGALVDADTDAANAMFEFTLNDGKAYVKVGEPTRFFDDRPLPLRSVAASKAIDAAALPGIWKFSFAATRAVNDAVRKEHERLKAVYAYEHRESLENRMKKLFPDGPPAFIFHPKATPSNTAVVPGDNAQRSTSGQSTHGALKTFSYGTWEDMVVLFNDDGWAYVKPNTDYLRMIDGRLHWVFGGETIVFERDAASAPKATER
ncbi:MAG: hypothetical protein QM783_15425 [Phycisphaerales bacterium]